MPTIAFGDQVWDAADPIFEEDEGHFRVEDIVTVVEHEHVKETDLEVETVDADDIVTQDLEATTIETSYVKSGGIETDTLEANVMEVTDNLIYRGTQYHVTNKYQPLDLNNVQADEENVPFDTIVTRSLVNGTRVNNLQVRADDTAAFQSSGPQGNFPGLFFTEGWCSERLTMLEDGHGLFVVTDQQGAVDPDAFVRWGHLSADVWGFQANDDTNQTQILPGSLQLQGGHGQAGPVGSSVSVTDAAGVPQLTIADNGMIEVRRTAASTNPVLSIRDPQDQLLWTLNADGHFSHASHPVADPTHAAAGAGPEISVLSAAFADNSIFVGSAKLSYDRAAHELKFEKLKHQMPKYFSDLSITESSLPSGYTTATMSVQRYLALARQLASDDALHLGDVFPSGHTVDWEIIDAPVPELKADVVEALSDIVTLESEMDTAQAAIVAAQADIVTLQGASGGLGSAETIANTNGDASLTLTSAGQNPESFIRFTVDDQTNANQDRDWLVAGTDFDNHGELLIGQTVWSNTTETAVRCFIDGNVGIQTNNSVNRGCAFGKTVLFKEKCDFWADLDASHYNSDATFGTGQLTCGSVIVSGSSIGPAVIANTAAIATNVTAIAANAAAVVATKTKVYTGSSYFTLTDETCIFAPSGNAVRFRTPNKMSGSGSGEPPSGNVIDGKKIDIFVGTANQVDISEIQYASTSTTFHSSSVGYQSTVYVKLTASGHYTMMYFESLDQWLVM